MAISPSSTLAKPFPAWTAWQSLGLQVSDHSLALILDDGQAFRWHALPDGTWLGFFDRCCIHLRNTPDMGLEWSSPAKAFGEGETPAGAREALVRYLALDSSFEALAEALPWRSDTHLKRCMELIPGLRLLRQPLYETLLCFQCSATKQIPQIKQMAEHLAAKLGKPIARRPEDERLAKLSHLSFHRLPSPGEVAAASEAELRACALGFRAGNIHKAAKILAQDPQWLPGTAALPYAEAHARFCELPGVGAKIADCVLLYSGTQLCAFPVDTWILKIMARHYKLDTWSNEQIAHFGRMHFGPAAGLAQQFLFNYERNEA